MQEREDALSAICDVTFFVSLWIGYSLERAIDWKAKSFRSHDDVHSRRLHLKTAAVRLRQIDTKVIGLNGPFAEFFAPHRIASKRPVAFVDLPPVLLIRKLFACEFCAYLRTRQFPEIFCGNKSGIESNEAPDAGKYRDEGPYA